MGNNIVIETKNGTVVDVRNLPEGWGYELIDQDVKDEEDEHKHEWHWHYYQFEDAKILEGGSLGIPVKCSCGKEGIEWWKYDNTAEKEEPVNMEGINNPFEDKEV